jgi:hypothetical protein
MIRIFTRQIEKLSTEEGQAIVFVAMVGLVIFLFFAMTMNVAELVNTKIKNQNVADATALSAAIWQARALNLVAAANMNLMQFWVLAFGSFAMCPVALAVCFLVCGEVWVSPVACIACLIFAGFDCGVAIGSFGGVQSTGQFQDMVLDIFDRDIVETDLPHVVSLNYYYKENTRPLTESDPMGVGHYLYMHMTNDRVIRRYVPGEPEVGEYVLERVGVCETLVSAARYANYIWHLTGGAKGLDDAGWQSLLPGIQGWFTPGGPCNNVTLPPAWVDAVKAMFPLAIRTRRSNWTVQNIEDFLPASVATFKEQEPPPVLGKGDGPWDCAWADGDTRFACPNARHYAFASSHAFSESVSDFYNTMVAGIATPYPIPMVPFVMDWEPRLFPFEPYPYGAESQQHGGYPVYQDIANQILADGLGLDRDFLLNHVLTRSDGRNFFLY